MKYLMMIVKGILAGMAIALGGLLFILVTYALPNEGGKILGALVFPIGLSLVCFFKLNLFTGKIGLVFEKRQEKDFYVALPLMYLGNIIGAVLVGYLCFLCFRSTDIMSRVNAIVSGKSDFSSWEKWLAMIVKSLITGLCVYLAVKGYALASNKIFSFIAVFVFIGIFVYIAGDHCIANMFYFSFGNSWTGEAFLNVALATLCNSLGTLPGVLLLCKTKRA